MSIAARKSLVSRLTFQRDSQRTDLLDRTKTQTDLIALLIGVTGFLSNIGLGLEITAVKTDHHDDRALGLHCHFNGYAVDCWPILLGHPGVYTDAGSPKFQQFLKFCAKNRWLWQIGLAGEADTLQNRVAAGATYFPDDGGDHVHLGAG